MTHPLPSQFVRQYRGVEIAIVFVDVENNEIVIKSHRRKRAGLDQCQEAQAEDVTNGGQIVVEIGELAEQLGAGLLDNRKFQMPDIEAIAIGHDAPPFKVGSLHQPMAKVAGG